MHLVVESQIHAEAVNRFIIERRVRHQLGTPDSSDPKGIESNEPFNEY